MMITDRMYGRWTLLGLVIIMAVTALVLLFRRTEDKIEKEENVLDKLLLTYYRQNDDCPGVEEKVELVDSVSEPGKKERVVTLIDIITHYSYKFPTGEVGSLPWRPILTCKDPADKMVVDHVSTLIGRGGGRGPKEVKKEEAALTQSKEVKDGLAFQMALHEQILNRTKNGFFFEYRSYQDDMLSPSLYLEKQQGWTGLLLDPIRFVNMSSNTELKTSRKAFFMTGCLLEDKSSHIKEYTRDELLAPETALLARMKERPNKLLWGTARSQCYNLESILRALDQPVVDLLVLNGFGTEVDILEQLPFTTFRIKVLVVSVLDSPEGQVNHLNIRKVLVSHGYEERRLDRSFSSSSTPLIFKIFVLKNNPDL